MPDWRIPFSFRQSHLLYFVAMLKQILEQGREAADIALEQLLPPATQHPTSIHQAMRHSVFAGGKRLRPILCMEAGRMIEAHAVAMLARPPAKPLLTGIE